jgi:hypothetical protein
MAPTCTGLVMVILLRIWGASAQDTSGKIEMATRGSKWRIVSMSSNTLKRLPSWHQVKE